MEPVAARVVGPEDVDAVTETLALAFFDDPVWSWVFDDPAHRHGQLLALWGLHVAGAAGYRWVWSTTPAGAVAVWIPPGCAELPETQAAQVEPLLDQIAGPRRALVLEVFDRFDAAHPHDEDHFYLSLLGTHPDHRGQGIGMRLLAENLARIDEAGLPAYLESSNPANLDRYESVGFETCGEFTLPDGGPTVTTMWRERR
jgi:ribosomal protein S18 acetylase RimI-like enzyme